VQIFKQQARLFKSALLAGGINANQHLFNGKDGRKSVHIEGGLCTLYKPPLKKNRTLWVRRSSSREKKGFISHHALGRRVMMVRQSVFVPDNLPIQLVHQIVDGRIEVLMGAFCK